MNSIFLNALNCCNFSRPPVWLMRQAGRYMPEYRKLRANHSFLEMCHRPDLICEVTNLPIQAFEMDAAILFSDILLIPEALNVGLRFDDGIGPIIDRPLSSTRDIESLPQVKMNESLQFVAEGIKLLIQTLKVPLIGFCGAPFTLASYMIEGKSSRDLRKTKQWMLKEPDSFHRLLNILVDHCIHYLEMQVLAGVKAIQVFDSWAGVLGFNQFREFSLFYLNKIVAHFKSRIPIILFCKGSSVFATELAKVSPSAISIDWNANLSSLRHLIPPSIALQGNLDPDILYAPLNKLRSEVQSLLKSMHGDPAYIFNLGHGITPDVSVDKVKALVDCVKEYTHQ